MAAIKNGRIQPGDVLVLICRGPMGAGMEETYQLTSALRYLPFGKHVAILTDARFSGVSTGACIGHVSPEALAGGPIGKLRDGDLIQIVVDRAKLEGTVDLVGEDGVFVGVEAGAQLLQARAARSDLAADPLLPDDTRLWAALQDVSGGTWGGCRLRRRRDHQSACRRQESSRDFRMTEGTKDTPSREMSTWLSAARCLPDDHDRAELVGRVWWPKAQGPTLVRVQGGSVYDLSAVAPTASQLLNLDDPVAAIRRAGPLPQLASAR